MKKTKILDINVSMLDDITYLNKNGLNTDLFYKYFITPTEIVFSSNYLLFNNGQGVHLFTRRLLSEVIMDNKLYSFIECQNIPYYHGALLRGSVGIDYELVEDIFGTARSITIDMEKYSDDYVLQLAFKLAIKSQINNLARDYNKMSVIDKDNVLSELCETEADREIVILNLNGNNYIWAYLNASYCDGGLSITLNIADYEQFTVNNKLVYNSYLVPIYILKNLLDTSITKEDRIIKVDNLMWSNFICHRCKFDATNSVYSKMMNLIYKVEEDYAYV